MTAPISHWILVVDDNPATLYATSRVLRSAGLEVIEATTGAEALALATGQIDLVVLDVNLPDTDGFEVCRKLRESAPTVRTPVLHLSATNVRDEDKVRGLETGADAYLVHPVEPQVLVATVNAFLRTRRAEDEMRKSETKFRAVFERALNGIALLGKDLRYLEVNDAFSKIVGRSPDEVTASAFGSLLVAGSEKNVHDMTAALEECGEWQGTFSMTRVNGEIVDTEWNISIHSIPGVRLAVVTDVSRRKAIEGEKEQLLASERAARTQAETANRVKDEFLATLSHELRTPLNAIIGWSHVLKQADKKGVLTPADFGKGIEAIERNARVQAQLIADLLDVSRITSGKLRLAIAPADIGELIEAAIESVLPAVTAKEIRLSQVFDRSLGIVRVDSARIQQVVWNLVNNAVKFTDAGGHIQISLAKKGAHAEIVVQDDGQGIARNFLPYIFERFRQEDATTTRSYGGLGLGLAIVRHIVEMHGGLVHADSDGEGLGARFTVLIPLVADAAPVADVHGPAANDQKAPAMAVEPVRDHGATVRVDLTGIRIVIVDDDSDTRILLVRILEELGAETFAASNVLEGLNAIETFTPHVLVSDIGMPERDGYDLIRHLRQTYSIRDLPAVALTAFARPEDVTKALQAGYQAHVAKPLNISELTTVLGNLVARTPALPRAQAG